MSHVRRQARKPFGDALRELMKERGLTFRELEAELRRADPERRGLTNSHLVNLAQQRNPPSARAMNLVATVFSLPPGYFLEARIQAAVDRLDLRHLDLDAVLAHLDQLDAAGQDQSRPPDTPATSVRSRGPSSRCELCGYQPAREFGDGAEVLLREHPGPDDEPMTICANCRGAVLAGLHPTHSVRRGARLDPPPSADDPGDVARRSPPRVDYGPGWVIDGPPVDTSRWPREEFTEDEPPPGDQTRRQAERSPSPTPGSVAEDPLTDRGRRR